MKINPPRPISAATSSFAAFTFDVRFPHIINRVKANNPLQQSQLAALDELAAEIAGGTVPLAGKESWHPDERIYWDAFFAESAG